MGPLRGRAQREARRTCKRGCGLFASAPCFALRRPAGAAGRHRTRRLCASLRTVRSLRSRRCRQIGINDRTMTEP